MTNVLIAIAAIAIGFIAGFLVRKTIASRSTASAESKAVKLLEEAKTKHRELVLDAKDKSLAIIEASKKEERLRLQELDKMRSHLENRESQFDKKILELENNKQQITDERAKIEKTKEELTGIRAQQIQKLERIAGLNQEEAKTVLLDYVEKQSKEDLVARIKKTENEADEHLAVQARNIIATSIQRFASSQAVELTTTSVELPSDEMKGRIIGREGRNIKVIEQLCGVEIIVDDTPNVITVSGFSMIRRHLAKRALEKLMKDGRIHPAKIEEAVEDAKRELALDIKKAGEDALYQMGVTGLDPKLVQILGRLKYRTSYGQNVLQHSIEVGLIAGMIASELKADVMICKKGGLLHDIGKAVDHDVQGSHPEIGYQIMRKFNLPEEIAYQSIGHHEDRPKTLEAAIVKAADAISGSRPGARKDTFEQYVQRLEELENLALSFEGVDKCYAIQAGREIRVFVLPEKVDDLGSHKLARAIALKIEADLKYPGEIKVNVIRENRIVEYAR